MLISDPKAMSKADGRTARRPAFLAPDPILIVRIKGSPSEWKSVTSLVIIEPSTALLAKAALCDHLLQQSARPLG
jgi:hypothetical protein